MSYPKGLFLLTTDVRFYSPTKDQYPDEFDKMFYVISDDKANYTTALESCKSGTHKGRLAILKTKRQLQHAIGLQKNIGKLF